MFIMYSDCDSLEDFLKHMDYFYVFMYFLRCENVRGMDFKQRDKNLLLKIFWYVF